MCWDSVLLQSLKLLLRKAFDHPIPIDQEGLSTSLLHLSLWVKCIMISAVSQTLNQDLSTFYSSPPCCYISPQCIFKHFFRPTQEKYSISGKLLNSPLYPKAQEEFQIPSLSYHPQQNSNLGNFSTLPNIK